MIQEISTIIGLGNPGAKYNNTRHNLGCLVVDRLTNKFRGSWKPGHGKYYCAKVKIGGNSIVLLRSTTYMNNTGIAVLDALNALKIEPGQLLAVLDDFALPLGTMRMRKQGSDGGHNGLASIIYHLETDSIPRLRVGIGPVPQKIDPADFVLSDFSDEENEKLSDIIEKSVDATVMIITQGIERAMEFCNRKSDLPSDL